MGRIDLYDKIFENFFGTVFTLLILIGSCVFYAFKIEPYRIASNQLYLNEKTSDFIKVVQFSDYSGSVVKTQI